MISDELGEGQLSEELYERVRVFPISLSPFRERPEDALALLGVWIERLSGRGFLLREQEQSQLSAQRWPGNGREVIVLARRLAPFVTEEGLLPEGMLSTLLELTGEITPAVDALDQSKRDDNLLANGSATRGGPLLPGEDLTLDALERAHIESLLERHQNISQVSKILGINRRTLQRKLKAWSESPR